MPSGPAKPDELTLHWSTEAEQSLRKTMARIYSQDPGTAEKIFQRTQKALDLLLTYPDLGTPVAGKGIRRFAIPNTGHTIEYQVKQGQLRITQWMRQRRRPRRR